MTSRPTVTRVRRACVICLSAAALLSGDAAQTRPASDAAPPASPPPAPRVVPMEFEANAGQTDPDVRFLARGNGYTLFLTEAEAVLSLRAPEPRQRAVVRMTLSGARQPRSIDGVDRSSGRAHYLRGNDRARWHTDVSTFRKVVYSGVYDGIDLLFHGEQGELEYDFVVAPGAHPSDIRVRFGGTDSIAIDERGELWLRSGGRELRQPQPVVFQELHGRRERVAARYVLDANRDVRFALGRYDETRPLVIDPVLVYSTYLGGTIPGTGAFTPHAQGQGIAADVAGNTYVAGSTDSPDFPTRNAFQPTLKGGIDAFIAKFAPDGTLVFSTFLGGASRSSRGVDIAVDAAGNIYVAGYTGAVDFPITPGAFLSPSGVNDAFITKLNPQGSALVYSTIAYADCIICLPSIALDSGGNVWLTGGTRRDGIPLVNPLQPQRAGAIDAIILALNPTGTGLVYATYLGGGGDDDGLGIAVGPDDTVYVTGRTASANFPVVNAAQPVFGGGVYGDCWVARLPHSGASLMYSTFLGGIENELDCHIAVGSDGAAYIAGGTPSPNFPIVRALQPVMRGLSDIFVTKLDPGGAFVFSSFIGGGDTESATAVTVDGDGSVFMTGVTGSADFPRVGFVEDLGGPPEVSLTEADVFVLKLHASGAALVYSTDIGGDGVEAGHDIAVDAVGAAHVTGLTISLDFPTRNALQPTAPVFGEHAFVLKVSGDPACSPEVTSGLDILSIGYFHVPLTPLRFAVVLMHNRTGAPITGPLAYVMDDLRHAVFVGSRLSTRCFSTPADPLMLVDVGADRVLSPGEVVATGLWFYQTDADAISYLPRVLSGVPSR